MKTIDMPKINEQLTKETLTDNSVQIPSGNKINLLVNRSPCADFTAQLINKLIGLWGDRIKKLRGIQ